ncbi:hypothetical protein CHO01_21890 [Cellulomonas hominis]|uniref:Uncharacterized protein n=1 Tax=Cellulomonas hominis TaxID=156981 RepID=A0A511FCZ3_9CELL|nr:hypothetical protein [Cellulomonas hominis]MBB5474688.1 hypothetical protein [Cellulomonas hominis]NKY05753.1 hypothetical protein [Cellulomonas hominis]GEL47073.1 hypothetical protein CHO01_21890 [Cellulomonas hominis]
MTTSTLPHPTPALLTEPYAARLARWFDLHPDQAPARILATSECDECGTAMVHRATADLTDSFWHATDATTTGGAVPNGQPDAETWLNWAAQHDIAAYSAAKAHRSLIGMYPWQHAHRPRPVSTADEDVAAMHASFVAAYGVEPSELVTTPVRPR